MSVETLAPAVSEVSQNVLKMSEAEIETAVKGINAATTEAEAQASEIRFEEIAALFLESHDSKIDALKREKQELVMDIFLDNPAEAFRGEFLQLSLLFNERALASGHQDGLLVTEFCTQNHDRAVCDYLFQHKVFASGREKIEVSKVFTTLGDQPELVRIAHENDELHAYVERRGHGGLTYDKEIAGDKLDRVLAEFFYDTIQASALQFERSADERDENNTRAKSYLHNLRERQYAR